MNLKSLKTDKNWTLFLDRDGVINQKIENNYVMRWEDFVFNEGVLEAFRIINKHFGKIIIVTNQQCIGKGLISSEKIGFIHEKMIQEISENDGRIDKLYFSPDVETAELKNIPHHLVTRKPGTAMALEAKSDFPEIDFARSIMVGDSLSDMMFGKRLGMFNVLIENCNENTMGENELASCCYKNLLEFALNL